MRVAGETKPAPPLEQFPRGNTMPQCRAAHSNRRAGISPRRHPRYPRRSPLQRTNGAAMRWFYLTIVIVFVAVIVIFVVQNRELVTMTFLGFSLRAPLAILAAIVYVLGAVTGGSLFALLRKSVRASRTNV
jgi:lipopolysaccharide assembly protein A